MVLIWLIHFIAFQAAIALLKDKGMENVIDKVYQKCKKSEIDNTLKDQNHVHTYI